MIEKEAREATEKAEAKILLIDDQQVKQESCTQNLEIDTARILSPKPENSALRNNLQRPPTIQTTQSPQ